MQLEEDSKREFIFNFLMQMLEQEFSELKQAKQEMTLMNKILYN
jgi:hypothetical protein